MASDSGVRDFEDLKFVDHYESKIESPEKEVISPTKEVIRPIDQTSKNSTFDKSIEQSVGEGNIGTISHDSGGEDDLDSGLEDSNSSHDSENERFIDRQEDIVHVEKPDIIKPPTTTFDPSKSSSKIVDELFNFINEENVVGDLEEQSVAIAEQKMTEDSTSRYRAGNVEWSLDAVNNNSEQVLESSAQEIKNEPKTETDYVLTVKSESPLMVEDNVQLVPDTPGSANMNLYWYSTNLELDPNEIQEFKNSQRNPEESESKRSSSGDDYYREKMEENIIAREKLPQLEDLNMNLETNTATSERWSPAFESASSRCLDLASELKAQPEDNKTIETCDTLEGKKSEHPWGLEIENKLVLESESKLEDLPVVEPKFHHIADLPSASKLNEKPGESSEMKVNLQVKKNVCLKHFDSDFSSGMPLETSEMNVQIKEKQTVDEAAVDQADAVGYMELEDKDIIKAQNAYINNTDTNLDTSNVYKQQEEEHLVKDLTKNVLEDSKMENRQTQPPKASDMSKDAFTVDEPDAATSMENVGQEVMKAQVSNSVCAQMSEKDVKNVDNLKIKSKVEVMTEQVEKDDAKLLQSENKEMDVSEMPEQVTVREEGDIVVIDTSILIETDTLENNLSNNKDVETNQEILAESSQILKSEIQKEESFQAQPTEKVEATVIKYDPVEIKRKFKIDDDSDSRIISKGGNLLSSEILVDQYFDDSCYKLTLNDSWFRKRNEKFELKTSCSAVLSGGSVLTDEKIIIMSLQRLLSRKSKGGITKTLSEVVTELGLVEFATFQTKRNTYLLGDYTFILDLTDFGFQSGDIMLTVDNPAKVSDGIQSIEKIAKELGFCLLQGH